MRRILLRTASQPSDLLRPTPDVQRQNARETYRLVGVDETDLDRNEVSWLSPLGKVLLGKRAGDRVRVRAPAGTEELVILAVEYS